MLCPSVLPNPVNKPIPRPRRRHGLTLIETALVVSILGLLASIAVPRYIAAEDRARDTQMAASMRTIEIGLENYHTDHRRYPATIVDPTFLAGNYLPNNHLPTAPWCKHPQTAQACFEPPYDFAEDSWPGIVQAAQTGICPASWLDDAHLADPPAMYDDIGVVRYNFYADSDVYQLFGQGKNGSQRTLLQPLSNHGV
ncbi:MAG TPA: prepilin-type N-terminal cleavage/methylation domain-containing protein [Oscillatoriaceae cyanobacterium]